MKINRILSLAMLMLLAAACRNDDLTDCLLDEAYIHFGVPTISVEETAATRVATEPGVTQGSTLLSNIQANSNFGVIGYCRAYTPGTMNIDYNSGVSSWDIKRRLSPPEVFNKQVVVSYDGTYCRYDNPKLWYTDADTQGNNDAANYLYSFFAYYPAESFSVSYPQVDYKDGNNTKQTDAGAPIFTYTMHSGAATVTDTNTVFQQSATQDVMLAATYNVKKSGGKVNFDFAHVLTALSFAVNNYSEGMALKVYKIELSGTFWRTVKVDLNQSASADRLEFSETYKGRYVIYDNPEGLDIPEYNSASPYTAPFADQYILLISGQSAGIGYLGDVKVSITYQFGSSGVTKTAWYGRPTTFVPRPGTKYTAQLNYVGNAFVLQFVADNGEYWEEGSDSDLTFE